MKKDKGKCIQGKRGKNTWVRKGLISKEKPGGRVKERRFIRGKEGDEY